MTHLTRVVAAASIVTVALASQAPVASQSASPHADWPYFGGNKAFTRYSALDQINRDNVSGLRIAWRRPAVNPKLMAAFPDLRPSAYLRATPIAIDGVLYTQDAHGLVIALDGETGQTIWEQQPFAPTREEATGASTRGVDYWRGGPGNADKRILSVRGEYLYATNADTGRPVEGFGDRGRVSLRFVDRQPLAGRFNDSSGPIVVGNVVVVAGNTAGAGDGGNRKEAAPEDVRGYDVVSGTLLWTFHVVPQPGEFGNETWGNDSWKIAGDLGAWNPMSADEALGYVYVPLTSPTAAWYGGWRPGDNLFSNALVALDVKTGKRVWHFQTVHHDLWDWDNIGPPILGDITVDGRRIRAVMQANKAAFLYVLDRTNGRPVWPIEERPVPQSTVPGERSSPTQPFPTKPPAFDLQGISDHDLIDYTPALKERARAIAKQYVMGPVFTPPSVPDDQTKGTLVQPGAWGSANWNTGAFDPETGYYYAISQTLGPANRAARKQTDKSATMEYADFAVSPERAGQPASPDRGGQPASQSPPSTVDAISIDGLPIIKGPYGRITAIDLTRGEHVWVTPNGDGPRFHPLLKHLNLPPLGYPNRPAPLVTKTLLFLGEGSNAVSGTANVDWTWGKKFRAYDKATGKVIWETELPSGTTAGPMTYLVRGKQYIVVSVGARDHAPEYVALALPTTSSTMPRTADGKPDFSGNWTNATITPFERALGQPLVITEDAARELETSTRRALAAREEPGDTPDAAPRAIDASTESPTPDLVAQFERRWQAGFGPVGGYNSFWVDTGEQVLRIDGRPRSSILVDPPDGRVPPMTADARARLEAIAEQRRKAGGEFDHPELRPLAERCIMSFGNNAGPPMLPNYWYNNNYTFTQAGTQLALLTEMVHDTRIVRIGGTHAPKTVRPWMGDSIGRWEGDTLVVETTNFHPQHGFRGASENLTVTERFTMRDANTILYRFTIEDPTTWTTKFSGELAFRRLPEGEAVYEYACHEGNYALEGVLRGARAQEREASRKKSPQ